MAEQIATEPTVSTDTVAVQVLPRKAFAASDFRDPLDQFKDVVILSDSTFAELFDDARPTGYVELSTGTTSTVAPALRFADGYDGTVNGRPKAYLRNNIQQELAVDRADPVLDVRAIDEPDSGPLEVVRLSTQIESTEPETCRLHPEQLAAMNLADGDDIELYNPQTGWRLNKTARAESRLDPDQISLSTRGRKLLQAEFDERAGDDVTTVLHARPPVACHEPEDQFLPTVRAALRRLVDRSVGYQETQLKINIGLNADEGQGRGRVNEDTMDILAVEDGDRVEISAKDTRTVTRIRAIDPESHLIKTDEDIHASDVRDRTILLPSTVREEIDAVSGDTVTVRRETRNIAIRQITPSLFGFLGVFVGGIQTVDLAVPPAWQLEGIILTIMLSFAAIWLTLWPERERCR
ncbi:hypothetical protein [Halosegnis longus]|uniref:hypothetical protein n=1 Tax=Halosegnis longus TaxID=2216012 RepID=UPI00129DF2D0|nr:hypothetical protein [Halosegnis longus]